MEEKELYTNSDEEELAYQQLQDYKERCQKEETEWNYPPKPNRPATEKQRCDTDEELLDAYKEIKNADSKYHLPQCGICGYWFLLLRKEHCTQFVHVLPCRPCTRKMKASERERDLMVDVEVNSAPPNSPCSPPSTGSSNTQETETEQPSSPSTEKEKPSSFTSTPTDSFRNESKEPQEDSDPEEEPDYARRRIIGFVEDIENMKNSIVDSDLPFNQKKSIDKTIDWCY